jgi:hypothetical protein
MRKDRRGEGWTFGEASRSGHMEHMKLIEARVGPGVAGLAPAQEVFDYPLIVAT